MLSVVVLSGFGRFFRIYQKIRQLKIAKKNLVEFDFKISLIVARDQKIKTQAAQAKLPRSVAQLVTQAPVDQSL